MTPEQIIELLGLQRGTCGYMAATYLSPLEVAPNSAVPRTIGQAMYFLVTPDAGVDLHRIASDQIYHHYAGDALEVLLLPDDGPARTVLLGSELERGMRPQLFIPAETFHVARLEYGGACALLGATSWPGVADDDFERGDPAVIQQRHPEFAGFASA